MQQNRLKKEEGHVKIKTDPGTEKTKTKKLNKKLNRHRKEKSF